VPSTSARTLAEPTVECTLSDGRTLAYAVGGVEDGAPVVAHHGTPGSRLFGALLSEAAAAAGVRLLVPDRPGYGRSSSPPPDWTWADWRADLEDLLTAESIDRATALGFSGGGPFALAAGRSDRIDRVGLVSAAIPPVGNGLTALAKVPFALRLAFRLADWFAARSGADAVVKQYTDRSVPESVAADVAADFHEALRQGARAVERENRLFATAPAESIRPAVPVRAWHGVDDENAPLSSVRSFVRDDESTLRADDVESTLHTHDADHLGTLLDRRSAALEWLAAAPTET
jgi:pimeloyl-ACP methyl ester carboxylesterase